MNQKNIAVCGVPLAGKGEMLVAISRITNSCRPVWSKLNVDNIYTLEIFINNHVVKFNTALGPVFYQEETLSFLLKNADLVIYVIDADIESIGQDATFENCIDVAKSFGKTWEYIPWIFVLNKIDRGNNNPIYDKIPSDYKDKIICTIAINGFGIDLLVSEITKWVLAYEKLFI